MCSFFNGSLLTPNTLIAGDHFQWTDTVKGQVSSSFFLGYTVTNFVGAFIYHMNPLSLPVPFFSHRLGHGTRR